MSNTKQLPKYECIGGPLCGMYEEGFDTYELGIPVFCYEDDDDVRHFYRMAKHKGRRFWHYIGYGCIDKSLRPKMRPLTPLR